MDMDSKSKVFSYRGSMYLLLLLLIVSLIGGFIIYRYSLLSHYKETNTVDEVIFYGIIGVATATMAISLTLAIRLNRIYEENGRKS